MAREDPRIEVVARWLAKRDFRGFRDVAFEKAWYEYQDAYKREARILLTLADEIQKMAGTNDIEPFDD